MPTIRNLVGAGSPLYYLIAFDSNNHEREEEEGKLLSQQLVEACGNDLATDIFLISHGWMGDIPAAVRQYDNWIGTMHECAADQAKLKKARPSFQPLIVGLHWPSLPWGDEDLGSGSFSLQGGAGFEQLMARYADRIADTPAAREALRTIFQAALEDIAPKSLPSTVRDAYLALDRESGMGSGGEAPGDDREAFDPNFAYEEAGEDEMVGYDAPWYGGILSPLRNLSFWKMKDRARQFGEGPARDLLNDLQRVSANTTRFHLIGHSFGCIVAASMLRGPGESPPLDRPVHTVALLQGALSLWSFCSDLPHKGGTSGYFHCIINKERMMGPLLTTRSEYDTAVGSFYPLAAGIRRQDSFALGQLPKYGALGAYGARGPGFPVTDRTMLTVDAQYNFKSGVVYNLDSNSYICEGRGSSGAHNDIAKPEVAHAIWEAVQTPART